MSESKGWETAYFQTPLTDQSQPDELPNYAPPFYGMSGIRFGMVAEDRDAREAIFKVAATDGVLPNVRKLSEVSELSPSEVEDEIADLTDDRVSFAEIDANFPMGEFEL